MPLAFSWASTPEQASFLLLLSFFLFFLSSFASSPLFFSSFLLPFFSSCPGRSHRRRPCRHCPCQPSHRRRCRAPPSPFGEPPGRLRKTGNQPLGEAHPRAGLCQVAQLLLAHWLVSLPRLVLGAPVRPGLRNLLARSNMSLDRFPGLLHTILLLHLLLQEGDVEELLLLLHVDFLPHLQVEDGHFHHFLLAARLQHFAALLQLRKQRRRQQHQQPGTPFHGRSGYRRVGGLSR